MNTNPGILSNGNRMTNHKDISTYITTLESVKVNFLLHPPITCACIPKKINQGFDLVSLGDNSHSVITTAVMIRALQHTSAAVGVVCDAPVQWVMEPV